MGQALRSLSRHGRSHTEHHRPRDTFCKVHGTVLMRKGQQGESCWAYFHDAIVKGKLDRCREMLTADTCTEVACLGNMSPQQRLVHLDTVAFSKLRTTCLHMAALYRRPEMVKLFLDHGSDPTVMDGFGRTAAAVLLEHWPRVRFPTGEDGRQYEGAPSPSGGRDYNSDTMLQLQTGCEGELEVLDPLEDHSHGTVREREVFRQKVLVWRQRSAACLKHFLQHGVELNEIADRRRASTLLHIAARHDLADVIDLLMQSEGLTRVEGVKGPAAARSGRGEQSVRGGSVANCVPRNLEASTASQRPWDERTVTGGGEVENAAAAMSRLRDAIARGVRSVMRRGLQDGRACIRLRHQAEEGETSSEDLTDLDNASRSRLGRRLHGQIESSSPTDSGPFSPTTPSTQLSGGRCGAKWANQINTGATGASCMRPVRVSLEVRNGTAKTPLAVAIDRGSEIAARALLAYGADVFCVDFYGRSLLHFLCEREGTFDDLLREVIQMGVNVDSMDNGGNTPLHIAAYMSSVAKVLLLLSRGASPDRLNQSGKTPLFLAFHRKDPATRDVILLFLLSSNDVTPRDRYGRLPLALQRADNLPSQIVLENLARQCDTLLRRAMVSVRRLIGFANLDDRQVLEALPCPESMKRAIGGEEERKVVRALVL